MIFSQRIHNYPFFKDKLIKAIDDYPGKERKSKFEDITESDFHIQKFTKNGLANGELVDYFKIFEEEIIFPYYPEVLKAYYGVDMAKQMKFECDGYWYQKYNKGKEHGWHMHPRCSFSNVFFVQLEEGAPVTEFIGASKVEAGEGYLISWPSYMLHRSPPNQSDKQKIIISFNITVWD
tara:strand:+ start:2971 stop:3504 length:534 start_codon:yes stop_codon:yes gene_type:complete